MLALWPGSCKNDSIAKPEFLLALQISILLA